MSRFERRNSRHLNHGLAHFASGRPDQIVSWFGAMQAQDYASAKWALGVRCAELTEAMVEDAINKRTIVRTWALRSTLQLVAADDVHWLLALIGPVVLARTASMYRRRNLEAAVFAEIDAAIRDTLGGGKQLLREDLFAALTQRGIDCAGLRGNCILYRAALSGGLCPAGMRGKQTTYALLDEWLPKRNLLARDEALAELARRYFRSHGPASLRDFAWWSGLSVSDARRGIALSREYLCEVHVDDQACYLSQEALPPHTGSLTAHLLPAFDEYFLGYEDRSVALAAIHFEHVMTNNGIFRPTLLIDGEIVGVWTRNATKGAISIGAKLFRELTSPEKAVLETAAQRYADFLGVRCNGLVYS